MKYLFSPDSRKGTHVRKADGERGILREYADTVTVEPVTALVSPDDFEPYVAPTQPAPPAAPEPVPAEVPLWAFRQVLIEDSLLATILAAVEGNAVLVNFLEYGNFVDRASPSLATIAAQLGKTDAEVDQIFRRADALKL